MTIVPWGKVIVAAAIAAVFIAFCAYLINVGEARCQARWDKAKAEQTIADSRNKDAAHETTLEAANEATEVVVEAREQTNDAVTAAKDAMREHTGNTPAGCLNAVQLPSRVRDEGRKAVERARSALYTKSDG